MKHVSLTIRFEGGVADDGRLPIYEAATAMRGLARSLNIVTHSFANEEEIRVRADKIHGAEIFLQASKKGCFEEQADIYFDSKITEKFGLSVIANHYWDYLGWCWSEAVGLNYDVTSTYVAKLIEDEDSPLSFVMAGALESAMRDIQAPIASDPENISLTLARPYKSDVLTLDFQTYQYVSVREESTKREVVLGNVTKFNILSGFGRLYDDKNKRIMSFQIIDDPSARLKSLVVKSMQQRLAGTGGKMLFTVTKITNAAGTVKRYRIYDASEPTI